MKRNVQARIPVFVVLAVLTTAALSAELSLVDQGRLAIEHGDGDAAVKLLEQAVAQQPTSAEAYLRLGEAYGLKGMMAGIFGASYAGKARRAWEKAVQLDPSSITARYSVAQFYANAPRIMGGSIDKALEQAAQIKKLDPLWGHRTYAMVHVAQKKNNLARQEYQDALREQPDSAAAHTYYANYLASTEKNYPAAAAELERATRLDPDFTPAWYHIGRVAALSNTNLADGEQALKKYFGCSPKDNEPAIANAHYWLGMIYEKQGRKAEAKQEYATAIKLNPSLKMAEDALKKIS